MGSSKDIDISLLTNAKEIGEIFEIIDKHNPEWIVSFCDNFSSDYSFLRENWFKICTATKNSPKKIVLVKNIESVSEQALAEVLTSVGFCVRDIHNFVQCKGCSDVILSKNGYDKAKTGRKPIPPKWSESCVNCL